MPTAKEFTIQLEDRPGSIGRLCRALGNRGINILAMQASPAEHRTEVRLIVDDPAVANAVLAAESMAYNELEVVQTKLPHRPGEFGRVASRLGDANINIKYVYSGADANTSSSFVIFGVGLTEVARAAAILDEIAIAAGT